MQGFLVEEERPPSRSSHVKAGLSSLPICTPKSVPDAGHVTA